MSLIVDMLLIDIIDSLILFSTVIFHRYQPSKNIRGFNLYLFQVIS